MTPHVGVIKRSTIFLPQAAVPNILCLWACLRHWRPQLHTEGGRGVRGPGSAPQDSEPVPLGLGWVCGSSPSSGH